MLRIQHDVYFVGGREARRIPAGWQHPRDEGGKFIGLLPHSHEFDDGETPASGTMPPPAGPTEIVAYETVSEGTPISPAFPDTPDGRRDLVAYCAEHCTTFGRQRADAEAWAAILFGDAAISLDGKVIAHDAS